MKSSSLLFVTGASGFLGGHFIPLALKKGWSLRCLVRDRKHVDRPGLEWIHGDLRKDGSWKTRLRGCDTLVHLATLSLTECEHDPVQASKVIMEGFQRILKASREANVRRLIVASSAEVYGQPRRFPITERTRQHPLSLYGFLKACADLLALRHGVQTESSICILRFFNLYGCAVDGAVPYNVLRSFAEHILGDETVTLHGSVGNSRDFLHVRDAAGAIALAVRHSKAEGVLNVGSGRETSLLQLARRMARLAGRRLRLQVQPHAGRVRRAVADCSRARRILGFSPKVSLDEGLAEVLRSV